MYKPKDQKERVLHRMKIARGHLEKVIQMMEDDTYCIDVLHQSQAVQSALKQVDNLVLVNHLNTCAADAIAKGKKDEVIKEIMDVFSRKKI